MSVAPATAPTQSPPPKREAPLAIRIATSPWMWMMFVTLGFSIVFIYNVRRRVHPPDLPQLGQIPAFQLTDQRAQPVTGQTFASKVWIADFIFLGCQQSCPKLTGRMHALQDRIEAKPELKDKVKLVSFSVDPENDTPDRLLAYANQWKADDKTWSFLTGKNEDVDAIVVQGFKMQYGKVSTAASASASPEMAAKLAADGVFEIMHGDWFILVDGKGAIRGYYDSSEQPALDKLFGDASTLASDL